MQEKKRQLIFILIGLGSGIVLSGILSLVLLLNTSEYKNGIILNTTDLTRKEDTEKNKVIEEKIDLPVKKSMNDDVVENEQGNDTNLPEKTENIKTNEQEVTVVIPPNKTASQTCEILEDAGVVEDATAFNEYIRSKKMTTKINEGTFILKQNMPFDVLLDKLLVN